MSPWWWRAVGLSARETSSIASDRSTRVSRNRAARWLATCPPPLPSSSTDVVAPSAASRSAAKAASSAYSAGGEISGHQGARSP